jgi:hypothetical protein
MKRLYCQKLAQQLLPYCFLTCTCACRSSSALPPALLGSTVA